MAPKSTHASQRGSGEGLAGELSGADQVDLGEAAEDLIGGAYQLGAGLAPGAPLDEADQPLGPEGGERAGREPCNSGA